VLRFSLPDLRFEEERISNEPITAVGTTGSDVLAGRSDGKVFRVGPGDLRLTPVANFSDEIAWIGSYEETGMPVYVAVTRTGRSESVWVRDSEGRSWRTPHSVEVVHLGREQRLWLAGSGLWLRDERAAIHHFSLVPVAADPTVSDLIADPVDPLGVLLAVGERGVVRIRGALEH